LISSEHCILHKLFELHKDTLNRSLTSPRRHILNLLIQNRLFQIPRGPEINNFDRPIHQPAIHQNVFAFQIAVQNIIRVQIANSRENLGKVVADTVFTETAFLHYFEEVGFEVREGDVGLRERGGYKFYDAFFVFYDSNKFYCNLDLSLKLIVPISVRVKPSY
jgi:hypothetical protein